MTSGLVGSSPTTGTTYKLIILNKNHIIFILKLNNFSKGNQNNMENPPSVNSTELVHPEIVNDKELLKKTNNELSEIQSFISEYWHTQQELQRIDYHERRRQNQLQLERQRYIDTIYRLQREALSFFNASGTCLWQNNKRNKICFRVNIDEDIQEGSKKTISTLLSKIYGRKIKIVDDISDIETDPLIDNTTYLFTNNLDILHDDRFTPYISSEFFQIRNIWYRNLFTYTHYLRKRLLLITNIDNPFDRAYSSVFEQWGNVKKYKISNSNILETMSNFELQFNRPDIEFTEPIFKIFDRNRNELEEQKNTIKNFIYHMVNEDSNQYNYLLNWLSIFFQTLNKSKTTLVFIDEDNDISELFWNKIILPIFGSKFCSFVNNKKLEILDIEELIRDKIFINFSNFSSKYNNKISKTIEKLLTEDYFDDDKKTQIFAQTLITSNSPYEFIKNSYSKCTVIKVNTLDNILSKLNLPDKISLIEMIKNDLDDFCNILAQYPTHINFANFALNTEERTFIEPKENEKILINKNILDQQINDFINAIKNYRNDLSYFDKILEQNEERYNELKYNFKENMIARALLPEYFKFIYGHNNFNGEKLLDILRRKDKLFNQNIDTNPQYKRQKRIRLSSDS